MSEYAVLTNEVERVQISVDAIAHDLKLLSDPTRLQLLAYLKVQALCVCDLVALTKMTQPNISQHMRKLLAGNLVAETRKGQWHYYSLKIEASHYLYPLIAELPNMQSQVDALKVGNDSCC